VVRAGITVNRALELDPLKLRLHLRGGGPVTVSVAVAVTELRAFVAVTV
jgi:hypothetical protein